MKQNKYDLNDPLIHWRCKIEKQQADENVLKMCNHEMTHSILDVSEKCAIGNNSIKKRGKNNEIYYTNRRKPRNKKIRDKR